MGFQKAGFQKKRRVFLASVACQTAVAASAWPLSGLLRLLFQPEGGRRGASADAKHGRGGFSAASSAQHSDGPAGDARAADSRAADSRAADSRAADASAGAFLFAASFNSARLFPDGAGAGRAQNRAGAGRAQNRAGADPIRASRAQNTAAGARTEWMNRPALSALKDRLSRQGKIRKFHHFRLPAQNRTVYLYVFDSFESFKEWRGEVRSRRLFVREAAPPSIRSSFYARGFCGAPRAG